MSFLLGNLPIEDELLPFDSPSTEEASGSQPTFRSLISQSFAPKPNAKNTTKPLYNWNKVQQRKYINFLIKFRHLFDLSNEQRKCAKINVVMSNVIQSRTPAQCHSHHQKMMIKFGSIEEIIKAHAHFIKKKAVPKHLRDYVNGISNPNQSLLRQIKEEEQVNQPNYKPLWMQYADILGYSQPHFCYQTTLDF